MLLVAPDDAHPLVSGPEPESPRALSVAQYIEAIGHTVLEAHDRMYVEQAQFARTIAIPTMGVGTTQFDIDATLRRSVFDSGYHATTAFLATWDFEKYKAAFRSGHEPPGRRARLLDELDRTPAT
jgi:NTE family protein